MFTFLCSSRGFKELDGQVLDGEDGGVSLPLPLLILLPQAVDAARTQTLRLQGDLTGGKHTVFTSFRGGEEKSLH